MSWFHNLKTAWKITFCVSLLGCVTVFVGWMGITNLQRSNAAMDLMYERDVAATVDMLQAAAATSEARAAIRQDVIDQLKPEKDADWKQVEEADARFQEHMKSLEKHIATEQGRNLWNESLKAWAQWMPMARDVHQLAYSGKTAEAHDALRQMAAAAKQSREALNTFVGVKLGLIKQSYEENVAAYEKTRERAVLLIVAALLAALALAVVVSRAIAKPLAQAVAVLKAVAAGDFTQKLDVHSTDEVGEMASSLNDAVARVNEALTQVSIASDEVASASRQLSASAEEISTGAQEQASSLEETAASLEEITSTVKQNAENAAQADRLAAGSRETAEKGGEVVDRTVVAMQAITDASKRIADIITTIDEIAFQTNLLALNAAVEAARAGEQGRGFAVVAAEVRNLAQRSATASKEIKGLIQDTVHKVEDGSAQVTKSGETLKEIVSSVKRVTDIIGEISAGSREQSSGIEQVNSAVNQMDSVTQANASQTEELTATAESLASQATQLQGLVQQFKLDGAKKPAPVAHAPVAHAAPAKPAAKKPVKAAGKPIVVAKAADKPAAPPLSNGHAPDGFAEF